jgi:hypothetical protein
VTQLLFKGDIVGVRCKGCAQIKRLKDFPKAARREGRGVYCSSCVKKQVSAMNFQINREAVRRRQVQGGTAPLRRDDD